MTNEENLSNTENLPDIDDSITQLRIKLDKETIQSTFRTKMIGGLHEEDVLNYIGSLETKYQLIEQEMKKDMDELLSSRNKLQKELETCQATALEEKNCLQESLKHTQDELAAQTDKYKNMDLTLQALNSKNNTKITNLQNELHHMAEERKELEKILSLSRQEISHARENSARYDQENNILKAKIADLEKKLSNNGRNEEIRRVSQEYEQRLEAEKSRIEQQNLDLETYKEKFLTLEEKLAANIIEMEELRKISEKAEQELKLEKAKVSSYKISGFKDAIGNIYQQLENLTEEQVKINDELQQQLEFEQQRANKAEDGLAGLIKWVSELKDKLFNEQNLFETQLKQISERYDTYQSEINGCFSNLQDIYKTIKQNR
jgi:chromosome segregation ATPase